MAKNILIISFTFPPYSGVGGRRWAKFAKYLNLAGNKVEVIAAHSGFEKSSTWKSDVENLSITYHNSGYPKFLGIQPKTIFQKIMYRLSLLYMKATVKGNFFDKSAKWGNGIRKLVDQKIKSQNIDVVFVTCAPFHLAYHLLPLVMRNRNIKWVVDFRDPWTTNQTAYGFEHLSPTRKQFELNAEKEVVKSYDEIIAVAQPMTDYFKSLDVSNPQKFKTIFNGFDSDDFPAREADQQPNPNQFKFVFAGTLYDKALPAFNLFTKGLQKLKELDAVFYQKIKITLIGVEPEKAKKLNHQNVQVLPFLPFEQVRQHLYTANAGLIFLTPDIDWSLSTKFTDYMGAQLPVLVVSEKPSQTANFCENQYIGCGLNQTNYLNFNQILQKLQGFQVGDQAEKFSIKHLVKELL